MKIDPISTSLPIRDPADTVSGRVMGTPALSSESAVGQIDDFASMLGGAIADVAHQLRKAEAVSIAGIKGSASMQDVVEQVMQAEQTLQASIAVRDKVVAAYLEISRMQI